MGATIKDIAKRSGVGIATVSRVLNGSGSASKEAKERVMAAVRELNYVPNSSARNLKMGPSKTILVAAKSVGNPFFQKVIRKIEGLVLLRGYSLEIRNIGTAEDEMTAVRQYAGSGKPCGVIMLGGSFGYADEDFTGLGIPCVLVTVKAADGVDTGLYSSVMIDDEAEMRRAVEYLIGLGHRRIGCIYSNHEDLVTPNLRRFWGYRRALLENGMEYDPGLVSPAADIFGSGYEFGFNRMKNLMEKNPDMTAVVAMADVMAIGAAKAVLMSGRRIPEDISVIGFDGIEEAEYYSPALDTVAQPAALMAQHAVEALETMMREQKTSHIVLESSLLKRGSSARVR